MPRTFPTNSGSLHRLKVSLRCGCSENARQIRRTVETDRPDALAIERVLQCVAAAGMVSKVGVTTSAIVQLSYAAKALSFQRPIVAANSCRPCETPVWARAAIFTDSEARGGQRSAVFGLCETAAQPGGSRRHCGPALQKRSSMAFQDSIAAINSVNPTILSTRLRL